MIARWNSECAKCLTRKYLDAYPADAPEEKRLAYLNRLYTILASAGPKEGAPVQSARIIRLQQEIFGQTTDYTKIKRTFNSLMLENEERIYQDIVSAEDPLLRAAQYVMTGNYIDFGVLIDVTAEKLMELLSAAPEQKIDAGVFACLREELSRAGRLTYLTDNCGEVVLDKLFLKTIRTQYPKLQVTVIVRGKPALNDATLEDAEQIGLPGIAPVIGNGTDIPGTFLPAISAEAADTIRSADLVISKGQGNFETLRGCGLNIYYLFLCKCRLFTERFHVKQYEGILTQEQASSRESANESNS